MTASSDEQKYQAYPEYKDSSLTWMGLVPKHWNCIKFKWVLEEKKKVPNPDLPAGSISFGEVVFKNEDNLSPDTKASYQEVLSGEFLINPLNLNFDLKSLRTALSTIDVVVSTGYIVLRCDGSLHKEYLRWLLQEFDVAHMKTLGSGVRQTINFTDISNCLFFYPPNQEQAQIANFLDYETAKIDTLIDKQQQLIKLLKEKRQAVISHAVTKGLNPSVPMKDSGLEWLGEVPKHWKISRLKFESEVIDCRNKTPEYFEDGEYFVVRTTNVKNQKLNFNGALYTDKRNFQIWTERGVPPAGSILFTREAPTGEVCIVPEKLKFCMGQRMMNFVSNDRNYTNYLFDYLISDCLDRYIKSVSHGSTVSHLRVEQVENIPVLVPPPIEVDLIHSHISEIKTKLDSLEKKAKKAIKFMQERRTALISAAVTGKIDVRNWVRPAEPNKEN